MFNRKCDERRGCTGERKPRLNERESTGGRLYRGSVSEISPLSQLLQLLNTTAGHAVKKKNGSG